MKVKQIWILLFGLTAGIAAFLTGRCLYQVIDYLNLNAQTQGKILDLKVEQVSSNRFQLQAKYEFLKAEHIYIGTTLLSKSHLNKYAAEQAKQEISSKPLIYYSRRNPKTSSLEKKFPKNLLLRALLSDGILIYFFLIFTRQKAENKI